MLFVYIIVLIIAIVINIAISSKFSDIAYEKGYDGQPYFWLCFFLGVVGYTMVAALPDLELYRNLDEVSASAPKVAAGKEQKRTVNIYSNQSASANSSWTCTCGRVNASYVSSCTCGTSKREATK